MFFFKNTNTVAQICSVRIENNCNILENKTTTTKTLKILIFDDDLILWKIAKNTTFFNFKLNLP